MTESEQNLRSTIEQLNASLAKSEAEKDASQRQLQLDRSRAQQLAIELSAAKKELLAAQLEVLDAHGAARKGSHLVDLEEQRLRLSGEAMRTADDAMQQLVSARQAIQQFYLLATPSSSDGKGATKASAGCPDISSLDEEARQHYESLATESCRFVSEAQTMLKKAQLRGKALEVQIDAVEDMRLQLTRMESDAKAQEARCTVLQDQVESTTNKNRILQERLLVSEQEAGRAQQKVAALKSDFEARARTHQDKLASAVSEMAIMRTEAQNKNTRIVELESELQRCNSRLQEVPTLHVRVAEAEAENQRCSLELARIKGEFTAQAACLLQTQTLLQVKDAQCNTKIEEILQLETAQGKAQRDLVAGAKALAQAKEELACVRSEAEALQRGGEGSEETVSHCQRKVVGLELQLAESLQSAAAVMEENRALQRHLPRVKIELEELRVSLREKGAENVAKLKVLEEQLLENVAEALRLRRLESLLAEANEERNESARRMQVLEREVASLQSELRDSKAQLQRLQGAHDASVHDLQFARAKVAEGEEQRSALHKALMESEQARLLLNRDIGIRDLEVMRVREDNKRITSASEIEDRLKDALLQKSVLETHLSANEAERRGLEVACSELKLKEQQLEALTRNHEELTLVSWKLINAMSGYKNQLKGVGMCVRLEPTGAVIIKSLEKGGGAALSTLSCGDVLLHIDGHKVAGLSVDKVQALILGPAGTEVLLTVRSAKTGEKHSVTLVRGFDQGEVVHQVLASAKDACEAVVQLQRDLTSRTSCLDTVCKHHRQRYLNVAELFVATVRMLKESGKDGITYGRDELAGILRGLASAAPDTEATALLVSGNSGKAVDGAIERSKACLDNVASEGAMKMRLDAGVFQQALDAEQSACSRILNALNKSMQNLLGAYQEHARNTTQLRHTEAENAKLASSNQQLDTQLSQCSVQKDELACKLQACAEALKVSQGDRAQLSKAHADTSRALAVCNARVKALEQEREALAAEVREGHAAVSREEHWQTQCSHVQKHLTTVQEEFASVKGELDRVLQAVCSRSAGVGGVGLKLKREGRSGSVVVAAIVRGGAADCAGSMSVGDMIVSVNGQSVSRLTAREAQDLFEGTLGSQLHVVAQKNRNVSSQYVVDLVRSLPGVQSRKLSIEEQVADAIQHSETLSERVREMQACRRQDMVDRQELEEQASCLTKQVAALEMDVQKLTGELGLAKKKEAEVRRHADTMEGERDVLQRQVRSLTDELEERHNSQQSCVEEVEAKYAHVAEEQEKTQRACEFMTEQLRQCEADNRRLAEENANVLREVRSVNSQRETLQATLKLLSKELEEAIAKAAAEEGKASVLKQDAAKMQQVIDHAKKQVQQYKDAQVKSEMHMKREIETWQAQCSNLSAQLQVKQQKERKDKEVLLKERSEGVRKEKEKQVRGNVKVSGKMVKREEQTEHAWESKHGAVKENETEPQNTGLIPAREEQGNTEQEASKQLSNVHVQNSLPVSFHSTDRCNMEGSEDGAAGKAGGGPAEGTGKARALGMSKHEIPDTSSERIPSMPLQTAPRTPNGVQAVVGKRPGIKPFFSPHSPTPDASSSQDAQAKDKNGEPEEDGMKERVVVGACDTARKLLCLEGGEDAGGRGRRKPELGRATQHGQIPLKAPSPSQIVTGWCVLLASQSFYSSFRMWAAFYICSCRTDYGSASLPSEADNPIDHHHLRRCCSHDKRPGKDRYDRTSQPGSERALPSPFVTRSARAECRSGSSKVTTKRSQHRAAGISRANLRRRCALRGFSR